MLLIAVGASGLIGCAGSPADNAGAQATVTALPTATPTHTVTATETATATTTITETVTATATVTEQVQVQPPGPLDVTSDYEQQVRAAGMSREQTSSIVQVVFDGGVANVLTTMRYPWGGWACDWEPDSLAGQQVKFVRILHQDGSLFRICQ